MILYECAALAKPKATSFRSSMLKCIGMVLCYRLSTAGFQTDCLCLGCRENSGYYRSSLQLQAFLQIVVGEERLKAAKQLVIDRHAEP